jgi:hypothetical protein
MYKNAYSKTVENLEKMKEIMTEYFDVIHVPNCNCGVPAIGPLTVRKGGGYFFSFTMSISIMMPG